MNRVFCKTLLASSILLASAQAQANDVVAAEAFIDNPAVLEGSGTAIAVNTGSVGNISNVAGQLDFTALPLGTHVIYTRTQDAAGTWSPVIGQVFVSRPSQPAGEINNLTQAEYFFDNTDLGAGLNTAFTVRADSAIFEDSLETVASSASIAALSTGLHFISVRVKDNAGNWSQVIRQSFYRPISFSANNTVAESEFFIDTDPGEGLATSATAIDGNFDNLVEYAEKSSLHLGLVAGLHKVGFRSQDVDGTWSPTMYQYFELTDTDGDGINNIIDPDDDNDTISDVDEITNGTNPLLVDTDGDGLTDSEEVTAGTNPLVTDSDNDELGDKFEVDNGLDPLDATGVNGADGDADGDGFTNLEEQTLGTDASALTGATSNAGIFNFSAATLSVNEDAGVASMGVTRTGGSVGVVSVYCFSTDIASQAIAGTDYTAVGTTLEWADGVTIMKTCSIPITNDTDVETDETFQLDLSNPTGGAKLGEP